MVEQRINDEHVEQALQQLFPEQRINAMKPVEAGSVKHVFRIDTVEQDYALYMADTEETREKLRTGAATLRYVIRHTELPVPAFFAADMAAEHVPYPYYVTAWIGGEPLHTHYEHVNETDRKRFVHEAGRLLGELHENTYFDNFGRITSEDGEMLTIQDGSPDWRRWMTHHLEQLLRRLNETPFSPIVPEARDALEPRLRTLPRNPETVLHHNDYRPENVLLQDDLVSAILDWDWPIAASPAYSIVHGVESFVHWFGEYDGTLENVFYEGYKEERDLPSHLVDQKPFYHMLWELEQMDVLRVQHENDIPTDTVEQHMDELEQRINRYS